MKKRLTILSLFALLLGLASCANEHEEVINIINVNDLHGALFEEDGHKAMSQLKSDIDAIENQDNVKNTIVVGNGDMFQGSALSNLSKGEAVINAMNACGFDYMGIGNHEFDWGIDETLKYFDGDLSNGESTAKLINSNIYHNNELLPHTLPYSVMDLGFIKVGIVSYAPATLKKSILKTMTDGYDFRGLNEVEKVINECKKEADVIIANTHWGEDAGDRVNVELMNLGADAILDGHYHREYDGLLINGKDKPKVPVVQTRDQLKENFGLIQLTVKNKKVVKSSVKRVPVGSLGGYKKDETVEKVMMEDYAKYKDVIEEKLCVAGLGPKNEKHDKYGYRTWGSRLIQQGVDADVGVINNGGIRNVNIAINKEMTYRDIFNIMPFDNAIYIFELTGEEIKSFYLRDAVFACRNGDNDTDNLIDSETYKIAIIDYVALQNSQLEKMILSGKAIKHDVILRDMMANELRKHGELNIPFNPHNPILS